MVFPKEFKKKKDCEKEIVQEATDGCPIPLIDCVRKDRPDELREIRMYCNKNCQLSPVIVHEKCFKKLEERLVNHLKNHGASRHWTEVQIRRDLWTSSGLGAYVKLLPCKCGKGFLHKHRVSAMSIQNEVEPKKRKAKDHSELGNLKKQPKTRIEESASPRHIAKKKKGSVPNYQTETKCKEPEKKAVGKFINSGKQTEKAVNGRGPQEEVKRRDSSSMTDPSSSENSTLGAGQFSTNLSEADENKLSLSMQDCNITLNLSENDFSSMKTSSQSTLVSTFMKEKLSGIEDADTDGTLFDCNKGQNDDLSIEKRFLPHGLLDEEDINDFEIRQHFRVFRISEPSLESSPPHQTYSHYTAQMGNFAEPESNGP
jgi:hypothetical protein